MAFIFEKYRHTLKFEILQFGNNINLSCHVYTEGKKTTKLYFDSEAMPLGKLKNESRKTFAGVVVIQI